MAGSSTYLGIVRHVGGSASRLEPLYRASEDRTRWEPLDAADDFPNAGLVCWFADHYPGGVWPRESELWLFTIFDDPIHAGNDPKKDRYRVNGDGPRDSPTECIQLDAADLGELVDLLDEGLFLPFRPSRHVVLPVGGDRLVGPLALSERADGRFVLPPERDTKPFHLHRGDVALFADIRIDERPRLLQPPKRPRPELLGEADLCSPGVLLHRLLELLPADDPAYDDLRPAVELLQQRAADGSLPRAVRPVHHSRIERVRSLIDSLSGHTETVRMLANYAMNTPTIRARVEEAIEEAKAARAGELAMLDTQLAERRGDISAAAEQIEDLRQKLHSAESETQRVIEQERARQARSLDEAADSFSRLMQERLAAAAEEPLRELAGLTILRAEILGGGAPPVGLPQHRPVFEASEAGVLGGWEEAVTRLADSLDARGLGRELASALLSAFIAAPMVVTTGPGALGALDAVGDAIAGGRVLWLPVGAPTLTPADLLGGYEPGSRAFVPRPGRLVDLLLSFPPDDLALVVLDGIDRAPVDHYLLPILTAATDGRPLPLAPEALLAPADPYREAAQLRWPRNVLLAGTLCGGETCVPPPAPFWAKVPQVDAHPVEAGATTELAVQLSQLPAATLGASRTASALGARPLALACGDERPAGCDGLCRRVSAAMSFCRTASSDAALSARDLCQMARQNAEANR